MSDENKVNNIELPRFIKIIIIINYILMFTILISLIYSFYILVRRDITDIQLIVLVLSLLFFVLLFIWMISYIIKLTIIILEVIQKDKQIKNIINKIENN